MKSKHETATAYRPSAVTHLCNSNPTSDKGHSQILGAMRKMMTTPAGQPNLGSQPAPSMPVPGNYGPNPGPL